MVTEINEVFSVVREPHPVCSLVMSRAEYLTQLWEIFNSKFHSEFTFTLLQDHLETTGCRNPDDAARRI